MLPANKVQFLAILSGLAAIKPGAKLTPESLETWWSVMSDWSIEEFSAAAKELAKKIEFMPNPYHFEQLRKASRLTAGEAWAGVRQIVRDGGTSHPDPLVNQAVRALGGFRSLGMTNTDQMQFLERRFCEHYESIGEAEEIREAVPQLAGPAKHISAVSQLLLTKKAVS